MIFRTIKQSIQNTIAQRFNTWLAKRMPSSAHQRLSQKSIFIFPSQFGLAFLCFIVLLFVLGTNYQNNLILLMSYLFVSVFVIAMLQSFLNVVGMQVSASGQYLGFVEQPVSIPITLESSRLRHGLSLGFPRQPRKNISSIVDKVKVKVPVEYHQRGHYRLPRLTIESYFPLGLFRCWTHLQFDLRVVICPTPLDCTINTRQKPWQDEDNDDQLAGQTTSSDNFYELRNYIPGEALTQVAWKHLAKTGQWYSKSYQAIESDPTILALANMPSSNIEVKLAQLCFLILAYDSANLAYGVAINGEVIQPAHGKLHRLKCLQQVAGYGK